MKKLIFSLILTAAAQSQAGIAKQHCDYLQQNDPQACRSSSYCKADVTVQGLCKSKAPEFENICNTITYGASGCNANASFSCYYTETQIVTCSEK